MPDEKEGLPLHDAEFAYQSTFHWKPLVNGYSGTSPRSYIELLRGVRTFPSDEALHALRAAGVNYVTGHESGYGASRTARRSSTPFASGC